MKKVLTRVLVLSFLTGIICQGCSEPRYYHQNHHHTRGWYDHRHRSYPAGVNFDVEVH